MWIPSDEQIRDLHERVAPDREAFELVYTHCQIVGRIAEQLLGDHSELDPALVRAGCLLHDIGVYRLGGDAYLRHGVLGHELLHDEGYPEVLGRFCSCHTGMGLTREDITRQALPLPPGDYLAETPEEDLVMYADKFHSKKTPPVFVSADSYAAGLLRFGADKAARFARLRERFGEPDLGALAAHYGHRIV